MASKRGVKDASLGALAAQMAGLFSPPGSAQQPFNAVVLDSARGNLMNEQAKYAANKAKEENGGLLGGLGGAITGGLGGFMMGGPVGAAVGAAGGGLQGYAGPAQSATSVLGNTAASMANLYAAKQAAANPPSPKPRGNLDNPGNKSLMEPMPQTQPAWKQQSNWQNIMAGLTAAYGQPRTLADGTFLYQMPYQ